MQIGIISDIHANMVALRAVLEHLDEEHGIDRLLCAGDIVGYNTEPDAVIDALQERDASCVTGNHDAAVDDEGLGMRFNPTARDAIEWTRTELTSAHRRYLRELPLRYRQQVDGTDIAMVHGSPTDPIMEYVHEDKLSTAFLQHSFDDPPDVLITGHTHIPHQEVVDGTLCLNPGSVGQPRDGDPRASAAVLDTDAMEATHHRIRYDIDTVAEATRAVMGDRSADRLYDGA